MQFPEAPKRDSAEVAKSWGLGGVSFLLGLVAAPLPARWRRAIPLLEGSAWAEAAVPSGLIQAVSGIGLFALGYVAWFNGQLGAIDAGAEAAAQGSTWNAEEHQILGRSLLMGNPLLPIIYACTTFSGFALLVNWVGGTVRMLHAAITKEVMPDPVLGLTDFVIRKIQRKAAHESRERSKDRSPDRLILGAQAADGFAIIIETAQDFDWREGNTVVVSSTWYRLKSRSEQKTPEGVRLRYVLEEMPIVVAIRGMRTYDPGHAPIIVSSGAAV